MQYTVSFFLGTNAEQEDVVLKAYLSNNVEANKTTVIKKSYWRL